MRNVYENNNNIYVGIYINHSKRLTIQFAAQQFAFIAMKMIWMFLLLLSSQYSYQHMFLGKLFLLRYARPNPLILAKSLKSS